MKIQRTITTAALALAGLALTQSAARAATAGDLILSFRFSDNSNANDLEVDLGSQSFFTTTSVLNLNFGGSYYAGANAGGLSIADLNSVFGTTGNGWNALPLLVWDVAGRTGSVASNTHIWATQTLGSSQGVTAGASLTAPGGRIGTYVANFAPGGLTSPTAEGVGVDTTSQTNYTGALGRPALTQDFGFFVNSTESGVSASANRTLELYNYGNNTLQDVGTFSLTPGGSLTFTGSAVPEPTTFGLLGMAAVGLVGLRRRRAAQA